MASYPNRKTNLLHGLAFIQGMFPWFLAILSAMPLLILAYLGTFTRYLADDYSIAAALSRFGFWQAQVYWYQNWLGKFTHTFLVSSMSLAGVSLVPWLPLICLVLWSILLFWSSKQFFRATKFPVPLAWIVVLTGSIMFGTVKSLREYQQVVFWQSGIADYMSSVILSPLLTGIFIKRVFFSRNRPLSAWEGAIWFVLIFISGGCSETWSAMQIAMFGLSLFSAAAWWKSPLRKNALPLLIIGFLAACVAFIVIAKAPGNMNRDTVMAELSFDLFRNAIVRAFWDVNLFIMEWMGGNSLLILMLFLAGLCAGFSCGTIEKPLGKLGLGIGLLVGAYILLWAGFAPRFAVMGTRPPDRAIFTPLFLLIWMFVLLGALTGNSLSSRSGAFLHPVAHAILSISLAIMVIWLPVRGAFSYLSMAPSLRLYAQLWDERDMFLREQKSQGVRDVVVQSLRRNPALHDIQSTFWLEGDIHEIPEDWINRAAADYYGLNSITGRK